MPQRKKSRGSEDRKSRRHRDGDRKGRRHRDKEKNINIRKGTVTVLVEAVRGEEEWVEPNKTSWKSYI